MSVDEAFQSAKQLVVSSAFLVHYDPELELLLACDASAYGVEGALLHKMPDGS